MGLARCKNGFGPPVKYFTDRSKAVLLLWIFNVFFCLAFAMPLCASVYVCLVVICWERADLLALVFDVSFSQCINPTHFDNALHVHTESFFNKN